MNNELSSDAKLAREIYCAMQPHLEANFLGQAVAIHVESQDYAVGPTHSAAARTLLTRHPADGKTVTLTVGPPTEGDLLLAMRVRTSKG